MSDDIGRQLREQGRGLIQVGLRLNRVIQLLEGERRPTPPGATPAARPVAETAEVLFDLLDHLDRALERIPAGHRPLASGLRRILRRPWLRAQPVEEALRQGLLLARDEALDRLRLLDLHQAPESGPVDWDLHRVVERVPHPDPLRHHTIRHTQRRGWVRGVGSQRQVLRQARVSVFYYG